MAEVFKKDIDSITKYSQIYLEFEWERVKLESTSNLEKYEMEKELRKKQNNYIKGILVASSAKPSLRKELRWQTE